MSLTPKELNDFMVAIFDPGPKGTPHTFVTPRGMVRLRVGEPDKAEWRLDWDDPYKPATHADINRIMGIELVDSEDLGTDPGMRTDGGLKSAIVAEFNPMLEEATKKIAEADRILYGKPGITTDEEFPHELQSEMAANGMLDPGPRFPEHGKFQLTRVPNPPSAFRRFWKHLKSGFSGADPNEA